MGLATMEKPKWNSGGALPLSWTAVSRPAS
jgi:hypothetical protein